MYPMQQIVIQRPEIEFEPDNPFVTIASKVGAKVADTLDAMILEAAYEAAKREGFTHLVLIDKAFLTNALKHELERWKAEHELPELRSPDQS